MGIEVERPTQAVAPALPTLPELPGHGSASVIRASSGSEKHARKLWDMRIYAGCTGTSPAPSLVVRNLPSAPGPSQVAQQLPADSEPPAAPPAQQPVPAKAPAIARAKSALYSCRFLPLVGFPRKPSENNDGSTLDAGVLEQRVHDTVREPAYLEAVRKFRGAAALDEYKRGKTFSKVITSKVFETFMDCAKTFI